MNKKLSLILLLALPVMLLSCKKCYECARYEYCLDCTGAFGGQGSVYYNDCFDTPEARQTAINELEASWAQSGGTLTCQNGTEKFVPGYTEDFCGSKKETEDDLDNWESLGYKCTEQ